MPDKTDTGIAVVDFYDRDLHAALDERLERLDEYGWEWVVIASIQRAQRQAGISIECYN